jgi:ABC-type Fe3+/spermidine/putrescine transport system ATPase subunit
MRAEIRELQKSLGITAIYVTHDQEEAMSVSDRIALMQSGKLEQVGAPAEIYRNPASRFAAEFMGTTNVLPVGALRPEALRLAADAPAAWPRLTGAIVSVEMLGPITRLDVRLADGTLVRAALLDEPGRPMTAGEALTLAYDPARVTVLP